MDAPDVIRWLVTLIADFWQFDISKFEFIEVDQRPGFYLMIVTLRPKKE